jgi:hypothetical protein
MSSDVSGAAGNEVVSRCRDLYAAHVDREGE